MLLATVIAIVLVILIGYKFKVNYGVLAMAAAYLLGTFGLNMSASKIIGLFPGSLFFNIFGPVIFFSVAAANGTLEKITKSLLRRFNGIPALTPILLYVVHFLMAASGAGASAANSIMMPIAFAVAAQIGIPLPVVATGCVLAATSGYNAPITAAGGIIRDLITQAGFAEDVATQAGVSVFVRGAIGCFISYLVIYAYYKTWKKVTKLELEKPEPMTTKQKITLVFFITVVVVALVPYLLGFVAPNLGIVKFLKKFNIPLLCIVFAAVAMAIGLAEDKAVLKLMPWNMIVTVCGFSMLVSIAGQAGLIDFLGNWINGNVNPNIMTYLMIIAGGLMSFVASGATVVFPALFPLVPLVVAGTSLNPAGLFAAIVVGSTATAVSPFSQGGARALGHIYDEEGRQKTFIPLVIISFAVLAMQLLFTVFGLY